MGVPCRNEKKKSAMAIITIYCVKRCGQTKNAHVKVGD